MRAYYSDTFELPLPPGHRFPMAKYRAVRDGVAARRLASELLVPAAASDEQLLRVHTRDYVEAVKSGGLDRKAARAIGFPWSPELVERSRRSVGATLVAARDALTHGVVANLAGGTHHAFSDRGGGFCVWNDAAVAIRDLQATGLIERAVVIDCDVHQGDGTAQIFEEDPTVFTFSIHGEKNYPFRKQRSDLDVGLADGVGDEPYLAALAASLEAILCEPFDLAIYLAGADPLWCDTLGRLALSAAGLSARDDLVVRALRERGVPVVTVMAGGYARPVEETVAVHMETVRVARRVSQSTATDPEPRST